MNTAIRKAYPPFHRTVLLALLLGLACLTDREPPVVQITYPPDGSVVGANVNIMVDATDNKGVTKVEFFVDGWSSYTDQEAPFAYPWVTTALTDSTTHTIHVKAYDAAGNSAMSGLITLTLRHGNRPPDSAATPSGPWGCDAGSECLLSTRAFDPNGDSVAVRFAWGDGDTSEWSHCVRSSWDSVCMAHSWALPDTYFVSAQAKDCRGMFSTWSHSQRLVVSGGGPGTYKWRCRVGSDISQPAIASDGTIYITSEFSLLALSPQGEVKWNAPLGFQCWFPPVVGPNGNVYVVGRSSSGNVYLSAYAPSGSSMWTNRRSGFYPTLPAVNSDGTIYFSCWGWGDSLFAIRPDGSLLWGCRVGDYHSSGPVLGMDGTIYLIAGVWDTTYYLCALNQDSTWKWRCRIRNNLGSRSTDAYPIAVGENATIYVVAEETLLYAISSSGSIQRCIRSSPHRFVSWPAIGSDDRIYMSTETGIQALNADGSIAWEYDIEYRYASTVALSSDGSIYAGAYAFLYALNHDGSLKWKWGVGQTSLSAPTVATDSTILVCSGYAGDLYAIRGSGCLADAPWPKLHHDMRNTSHAGTP